MMMMLPTSTVTAGGSANLASGWLLVYSIPPSESLRKQYDQHLTLMYGDTAIEPPLD